MTELTDITAPAARAELLEQRTERAARIAERNERAKEYKVEIQAWDGIDVLSAYGNICAQLQHRDFGTDAYDADKLQQSILWDELAQRIAS